MSHSQITHYKVNFTLPMKLQKDKLPQHQNFQNIV